MPSRRKPLILWAEDDPDDRTLVRAALEELPSAPRVEFFEDGAILVDRLRADRTLEPDLVILDLKMPRMGGVATLRALRADERTKGLDVLVFSSGGLPDEAAQCRALGARDVVRKPIEFGAFADAVHRLVRLVMA